MQVTKWWLVVSCRKYDFDSLSLFEGPMELSSQHRQVCLSCHWKQMCLETWSAKQSSPWQGGVHRLPLDIAYHPCFCDPGLYFQSLKNNNFFFLLFWPYLVCNYGMELGCEVASKIYFYFCQGIWFWYWNGWLHYSKIKKLSSIVRIL